MSAVQSFTPIPFHQRGKRKVVIPADDETIGKYVNKPAVNRRLVNAVAQAFYWEKLIELGEVKNGSEIAQKESLEASTVNERLRLSLLSPVIVESILNGTQSEGLTMQWLTRNSLPANWSRQEKLFRPTNI